jgi:tetratricopeptide (TPR) repeat protein
LNKGQQESTLRAALASFDEAVTEDPGYAAAHAGRARALNQLTSNGYEPFDSGFRRAREAAEHAVELEPKLALAWLPLTYVTSTVDLDIPKAREQFERALALEPGNAEIQGAYSTFALGIGLNDEAIESALKAVQLDPIAPRPHIALATAYYGARRYDEALAAARRGERLDPEYPGVQAGIGYILLETGDLEGARAVFEREKIEWQRLTGLALADAKLGRVDAARATLAKARERLGDAAAYQYAEINAQLGDRDEAFRWLEVARKIRDPGLSILLNDPLMEPLHEDPRFGKLARELGLSEVTAAR